MTVQAADKLACAKRELAMRRHVYPRWVQVGKMTKQNADHEIACMEAIVADYEEATKEERLI